MQVQSCMQVGGRLRGCRWGACHVGCCSDSSLCFERTLVLALILGVGVGVDRVIVVGRGLVRLEDGFGRTVVGMRGPWSAV